MLTLKSVYIALFAVLASSFAQGACPSDQNLKSQGWVVHPTSDLSKVQKELTQVLAQEASDFTLDLTTRMMSKTERPVEVVSMDRLSTPQSLMYGDILTVTDLETSEVSELRWFDGRKHVVYNPKFQKCAMNFEFMAENALF